MKVWFLGEKIYLTMGKPHKRDRYLDKLVHPDLIESPLIADNISDGTIYSKSGTNSPISETEKIVFSI